MEETLSGEVNTPLDTISNFIWNPKIYYFVQLSCCWSLSLSVINLCPHNVTHWVQPSKNIGLVLEHQILHLQGKNQAFELKVLGTRLGHMPSSYINKLQIQGLNEVRSFGPPYSRLKGMAFTERNEVNCNTDNILVKKCYTIKMRSVVANTSLSNSSLVLPTLLFRIAIDCGQFRSKAANLLDVTQ